jgi:beta-lactamase superfamily II metal-dependent hydrolase
MLSRRGRIRDSAQGRYHGLDGSSDDDFVSAVHLASPSSPRRGQHLQHPSPTTLLRLAGIPLYRTDRNGSVRFETDGKRLFVRPDRGSYQLVPVSTTR